MFKISVLAVFFGWFVELFYDKNWKKEKEHLNLFASRLHELGEPQDSKNPFEYLVKFLQVCSNFQDQQSAIYHAPNYEEMKRFNYALTRVGRMSNINRTKKGEKVDLNNIHLGGVCGLREHSARTWQGATDDMRKVIVHQQILPFVIANRQTLLDGIVKMKK